MSEILGIDFADLHPALWIRSIGGVLMADAGVEAVAPASLPQRADADAEEWYCRRTGVMFQSAASARNCFYLVDCLL
jgi:hypothetical protein